MKRKNCPNCGAPIDPEKIRCSFCGTFYYDLQTLKPDEICFIKMKIRNKVIMAKGVMTGAIITEEWNERTKLDIEFTIQGIKEITLEE